MIEIPNWTENDLWISGNKKEQEKVLDFISNKDIKENSDECDNKILDFNKILPYPKKYSDMGDIEGYNKGGYEWCLKFWGTKWNPCNVFLKKQVRNTFIGFNTAWSPPLPLIKILSDKFPKLTFKIKFYEGGNAFCGERIFKNGVCLKQFDNEDYRGNRGG